MGLFFTNKNLARSDEAISFDSIKQNLLIWFILKIINELHLGYEV